MATMTIDDQIAEERAKVEGFREDLVSRRAAVASAEEELARLEAESPQAERSARAVAEWNRATSRAQERRAAALRGIENVERLRQAGITAPITLVRSPMLSQAARVVASADTSLNSELDVVGISRQRR